jgi:hypothetical protein
MVQERSRRKRPYLAPNSKKVTRIELGFSIIYLEKEKKKKKRIGSNDRNYWLGLVAMDD